MDADRLTMRDLPDVLHHLSHANTVQGGALLFSEGKIRPVLTFEEFVDARAAGREPLRPSLQVRRVGRRRVRSTANSAEAVRALKSKHGVPYRETREPVDTWSRRPAP